MQDLSSFLTRFKAFDVETASWAEGTMPLRIVSYIGAQLPPSGYITSVRGIVFRAQSVLVLSNRDGVHIMPGGRREAGESDEQTLRREVLEETGWSLSQIELLGLRHFRHLAPVAPDFPYPYPDFVWAIYTAEAASYEPSARASDDYEQVAELQPLERVAQLDLTPAERRFLSVAAQRRAGSA